MKFIDGDLLDSDLKFIAHGCNCQGVMGSGVALAIKQKWPVVFKEYKEYCDNVDAKSLLASVQYVNIGNDRIIVNAFTQENFGKGKQARYIAILDAFKVFYGDWFNFDEKEEKLILGIPKIGCGLGGLKWEVLEELLKEFEEMYNIEFHVYEPK